MDTIAGDADGLYQRGKCEGQLGDLTAAKVDLVVAAITYQKENDTEGVDRVSKLMLSLFGSNASPK